MFEHKTGRKCHSEGEVRILPTHEGMRCTDMVAVFPGCGGDLADSIINFGEGLPKKEWDKAETAFKQANVCVVLGSSCKVTPAAHLPQQIGQRGKQGSIPPYLLSSIRS